MDFLDSKMRTESLQFFTFVSSLIILTTMELSFAADMITPGQSIRDNETIVSSSQRFELGFFSRGNSNNRYLGIWYKMSPQAVVWVANRKDPISDNHGILAFSTNGNLVLLDKSKSTIWSSNSSRVPENPVAQLLDSGNLVLRDGIGTNSENESYSWQSFDYLTDTLLPGMKVGLNLKTGFERYLTAWRSAEDPSPGDYSLRLDIDGYELVITSGSKRVARSGPWNGLQFNGIPMIDRSSTFKAIFVHQGDELYYMFKPYDDSVMTRALMNPSGIMERSFWNDGSWEWIKMYSWPFDKCDYYEECGANSYCRINQSPLCECLKGFGPKSEDEWGTPETRKCIKKLPEGSDCRNGEGFLKMPRMKLPENSWSNKSMSTKECMEECLKNCSCRAYANMDIMERESGCYMWFGDLIDMKECSKGFRWGQDIFVRVPVSELVHDSNKKNIIKIVLVVSTISGMFILGIVLCKAYRKKIKNKGKKEVQTLIGLESREEGMEVPLFDLATIAVATNNFSEANMIGEGGFGPVYKGNISEGREIAVKRLAKDSRQGVQEFKNEVDVIGKLQHRNLVALIGGCIEGDERMLIYEYMRNKSLDFFIFDQDRGKLLKWRKRFEIIVGIARGLLYLHQDSKLKIVHRDLKTSNILLDNDLNPKISDFGLARIFRGDNKEVKTKRVVGTYGYMSPEYVAEGKYSMKSDVFGFGVLLLEIISGKRNRGFRHLDHDHNLIGHVWLLWNDGRALELIDKCLEDSFIESEVQRCIQVGLLCVQKFPDNRPEMSSVVFMLANEGVALPQPRQPGFFIERGFSTDESSSKEKSHSINEVSMTTQEGR